ncbi:MAG: TetR/AcrR family transcriptional regulator [Proteobacteria bacterium]|nr:TetR/AcrR family transcriptional regulator [Pseudomonadota bacterium]
MKNKEKTTHKRGRPVNEAHREHIIATAGELFMTHGLQATTMEMVARAAGMSKLTLYSRFESKDALFAAVIRAKCSEYIPDHFFGDFHRKPVEQSLFDITYGLMQLLTSDDVKAMEAMLMAEAKRRGSLVQQFYEAGPLRVKKLIAEHLEKLHEQGVLHIPDAVLATNLLTATVKGSDICMRHCMNIPPAPTQKDMQHYCRQAVAMFMRAHQKP